MAVVYYILLFFLLIVGLAITVMTLPGLWLMVAGTLGYALLTHWQFVGVKTLIALLVLAGLGEVVEVGYSAKGARDSGAGRRGTWGALIGGLLGGIFLSFIPIPVISTLVGVCLGTFLGAMIGELSGGKEAIQSAFVGVGAARGRLMGTLAKVGIGGIMFAVVMWVGFPHNSKASGTANGPTTVPVVIPTTATNPTTRPQ